jgi:hypothetical protein
VVFGGLEEGGRNIAYLQPLRRVQLIQKKGFSAIKGKYINLVLSISYLWAFGGYYLQFWALL